MSNILSNHIPADTADTFSLSKVSSATVPPSSSVLLSGVTDEVFFYTVPHALRVSAVGGRGQRLRSSSGLVSPVPLPFRARAGVSS